MLDELLNRVHNNSQAVARFKRKELSLFDCNLQELTACLKSAFGDDMILSVRPMTREEDAQWRRIEELAKLRVKREREAQAAKVQERQQNLCLLFSDTNN